MRVVVLGAGVVGLATAYYLVADGHESRSSTATTASRWRRASPTARSSRTATSRRSPAPACCPRSRRGCCGAIRRCASIRRSIRTNGAGCSNSCWRATATQSDLTTRRLLALSFYSRRLMHELHCGRARSNSAMPRNGKLVVYSDPDGFDAARRLVDYQRSLGCEQEALDRDACLELEPALADGGSRLGAAAGRRHPHAQRGSRGLLPLLRRPRASPAGSSACASRSGTEIQALQLRRATDHPRRDERGRPRRPMRFVLALGAQAPFADAAAWVRVCRSIR